MNQLKKVIEENGLKVTYKDKRHLWVKFDNIIIMVDSYDLFGLADDDLMLRIKQRFGGYGIKIDLDNLNNNKKNKEPKHKYIPINERKENIRKILKDKFKLLP